jgi:hypothetical protein
MNKYIFFHCQYCKGRCTGSFCAPPVELLLFDVSSNLNSVYYKVLWRHIEAMRVNGMLYVLFNDAVNW